MSGIKQISPQMSDVRPGNMSGSLNSEKQISVKRDQNFANNQFTKNIRGARGNIRYCSSDIFTLIPQPHQPETQQAPMARRPNPIQYGEIAPNATIFISEQQPGSTANQILEKELRKGQLFSKLDYFPAPKISEPLPTISEKTERIESSAMHRSPRRKRRRARASLISQFQNLFENRALALDASLYALAIIIFLLIFPLGNFIEKATQAEYEIKSTGQSAMGSFALAKENLVQGNFSDASQKFLDSYETLESAGTDVSKIGGNFSEILRYIPGVSKIATANYVIKAGEDAALAGKNMTLTLADVSKIGNPLDENSSTSLIDIFIKTEKNISEANNYLKDANDQLTKANIDDLPADSRPAFADLKNKLPEIIKNLDGFSENSQIVLDMLGYNGPRKFLLLFENNQEMRATGGFIGSYGILSIADGKIQKLFADDIYNPDGQLSAKIIPPEPIQKMSAVWTMHDANWFPNFPTSAEKVAWFYEKTGGPTVDGVIAITPDVIEKLLKITGPIDMPDYNLTIGSDNFFEKTQEEVEVNYDKTENQPKKFIADLMPKVLDQLINTKNSAEMLETLQVFDEALRERQLIMYSKNYNTEAMISQQGWSGEVLNTTGDYLSVINTNIDGYKTDGVIDETINHNTNIQDDGSVVDEVTITRKHNGGNTPYDWWNKVNGDYMRVYVPEGSQLLEASGQTREFVSAPLDYGTLGFKKDPDVEKEQESTQIDDQSGTRIYSEDQKTVFANWVYVSPGESVTVKYKYKLPIKLSFDELNHPADAFSILYQKQAGSTGSNLVSSVDFPNNYKVIWKYPDDAKMDRNTISTEVKLDTDKFVGMSFEK